ncbi:MAG: rod shape-determining protein RodA [Candidatus Levybacteria bacterium]|nr:rod shape-determining protein RodA [Candidatus Levybacteria bacterium]
MNRGTFFYIDLRLLVPALFLLFLGLTTLFSVNIDFFKSQLLFAGVSIVFFLFLSQLNYKAIQLYAVPIYLISLFLLLLVLLVGIQSKGAVRWFDILGLRVQFSEIMKPFLLVSLSWFLAKRTPSFKTFFLVILFLTPVLFLVYKQPDFGNAAILGTVTLLTLIAYGVAFTWIFLGAGVLLLFLPFLWRFLHEYQQQRIVAFFDPARDPLGTSYNAMQALIAIGSGMLAGRGMSQGTQSYLRFLPERHTDFIFATLAESLGFLGSLIVFLCFAFLLHRIFVLFSNSQDRLDKIFSLSAFFLILTQFSFNIGMNMGVLPIVGTTLPFVSYGGSSLLSNFILLGLLSSIGRAAKKEGTLEIG